MYFLTHISAMQAQRLLHFSNPLSMTGVFSSADYPSTKSDLSPAPPAFKEWNPALSVLHRAIQMATPLYCWGHSDSSVQGPVVGRWPWGEAINEQQFGECLLCKEDEYSHGRSNASVFPSPGSCDMEKSWPDSKRPVSLIRRYHSKIYTSKDLLGFMLLNNALLRLLL